MTQPHGTHRCARCGQKVPGLNTRICPGCVALEDRDREANLIVEGFRAGLHAEAAAQQRQPPPQPASAPPQRFTGPLDPVDRWDVKDGDEWDDTVRTWVRYGGRWLEAKDGD